MDDIAESLHLDFDDLLTEIEAIISSDDKSLDSIYALDNKAIDNYSYELNTKDEKILNHLVVYINDLKDNLGKGTNGDARRRITGKEQDKITGEVIGDQKLLTGEVLDPAAEIAEREKRIKEIGGKR